MREQCPLVNLPVTEVQSFQLSTGQSESSVVPSRCSAVPQWYSNWPAELSVRPKPSDCIAIGFVLICALGHTHSHTLTLSLSPAVSTVAAYSSALSLSLILSSHSLPASNRWRAQALALASTTRLLYPIQITPQQRQQRRSAFQCRYQNG